MFTPSGIIAFLSDFGLQDPYVGIVKAVLLDIHPDLRLVDLTHDIAPQDVRAGAFVLDVSYRAFPHGTVFLAVVDPGVGSSRAGLLAVGERYAFVAPDNGLLSRVLESEGLRCHRLEAPRFFRPPVSATFHARDIFAPAAAHVSLGMPPEAFGPVHPAPVRCAWARPSVGAGEIHGQVIHTDRFGSLTTNIEERHLAALGPAERLRVRAAGGDLPLHRTYSDVPPGEPLALVGSFGFLEIAVNQGSAAERLGLGAGAPVTVGIERASDNERSVS